MIVNIVPSPIPVPTVYVLWSDLECGLRVTAGCSEECGLGFRHSGTLTGGARYRALLGWGLLETCCACPRFVGPRGHLWLGFCGLPLLPDFHFIVMNITSTQWKQTPFF